MNKPFLISAVSIIIVGIALVPIFTQDLVDAKSTKKVHFTETLTSSQDPGQGHENHQLALILSPEKGIIYDGSLTYTSDIPLQVAVLHEIDPDESRGQPVWTVDGNTIYGLTLIDTYGKSGSFEFTGAALALHSPTPEVFTATVSVDGWIRGGAIEFVTQTIDIEKDPPSVGLFRPNVPVQIPMHTGLFNEEQILYIITDSSDDSLAKDISEKQKWNANVAPPLSTAPDSVLGRAYFFTNGVSGDGLHGFQDEVFSSTPDQSGEYSALRKVVNVSWKLGQNFDVLNSVDDILQTEKNGRIEIEETGIVINAPQIVWPDGQMQVRDESSTDDGTPYDGGQILEIDTESNTVTFVAHRGWGPDGRTTYCIVTDATPAGPAEMMGVSDAPSSAELIDNPAAADLYQFKNGLISSGPLGFQPGIAAAAAGDETYSPMWRISLVEWNETDNVRLLETIGDIDSAKSDGEITVSIARPTNGDHIINCPLVDPFQNSKDKLSS